MKRLQVSYKIWVCSVVALLSIALPVRAIPRIDSARIHFRRGYAVWDPAYRNNKETLDRFVEQFENSQTDPASRRIRIHIEGKSSPDGLATANKRLSEKRARTISALLRERLQLPDSLVRITAGGIDWDGLTRLVEADSACPARREVLQILRNTPEWIRDGQNRIVDGRKKQLMDLRGGVPYNYLLKTLFPDLRNTSITLYGEIIGTESPEESGQVDTPKGQKPLAEAETPASGQTSEQSHRQAAAQAGTADTARPATAPEQAPAQASATATTAATVQSLTPSELPTAVQNRVVTGTNDTPDVNPDNAPRKESPTHRPARQLTDDGLRTTATGEQAASASDPVGSSPLHRLAIKTNLLYDAILMPDLEVEYRIDDRWSVAVEGSVAWWKRDSRHKYYQIATIVPEGRYWFHTKGPWHGHYAGLFAGGSWYDLENGNRGYKGEFFMTGISYGYMFPVGRCVSLEAGIGVGFLHTVYEEYLPIDGHYVYQQTSRTNWIGPVKIKFAVVWRLWDQKKGGAR